MLEVLAIRALDVKAKKKLGINGPQGTASQGRATSGPAGGQAR